MYLNQKTDAKDKEPEKQEQIDEITGTSVYDLIKSECGQQTGRQKHNGYEASVFQIFTEFREKSVGNIIPVMEDTLMDTDICSTGGSTYCEKRETTDGPQDA